MACFNNVIGDMPDDKKQSMHKTIMENSKKLLMKAISLQSEMITSGELDAKQLTDRMLKVISEFNGGVANDGTGVFKAKKFWPGFTTAAENSDSTIPSFCPLHTRIENPQGSNLQTPTTSGDTNPTPRYPFIITENTTVLYLSWSWSQELTWIYFEPSNTYLC